MQQTSVAQQRQESDVANGQADAGQQDSARYDQDRKGGYRSRGGNGGQPMYRGSRPYDTQRGRGRGAYRGNFNRGPGAGMEGESSDAVYSQRPTRGYSRGGQRGEYRGRGRRGGYYQNGNQYGSGQGSHSYELADTSSARMKETDDVIELELDDNQLAVYEQKLAYAKENIKMLDQDDVARICHMNNFNPEAIDLALGRYLTDSKYQGLEQYEW